MYINAYITGRYWHNDLDRVMQADYGIQAESEIFEMDNLGNRESVVLRDATNVNYVVDVLTNRYEWVGQAVPGYDLAGNMTQDEDGYQFVYDYEKRIVEVLDSINTPVATFDYDALGRRIRKMTPAEVKLYYYNDNWQILATCDAAGAVEEVFLFGNYIDEVLCMVSGQDRFYYGHDHLYSLVALLDSTGSVTERYEYDAYGTANIYNQDFSAIRYTPSNNNPFLFTGREVDYLDSGVLVLQYNRNRYYSQSLGRWMSEDPLGTNPAGAFVQNPFEVLEQYRDGLNVYNYALNYRNVDPYGLRLKYEDILKVEQLINKIRHWRGKGQDVAGHIDVAGDVLFVLHAIRMGQSLSSQPARAAIRNIAAAGGKAAVSTIFKRAGAPGFAITGFIMIGKEAGHYGSAIASVLQDAADSRACLACRCTLYSMTDSLGGGTPFEYTTSWGFRNNVPCYYDGKGGVYAGTRIRARDWKDDDIIQQSLDFFWKPAVAYTHCERM